MCIRIDGECLVNVNQAFLISSGVDEEGRQVRFRLIPTVVWPPLDLFLDDANRFVVIAKLFMRDGYVVLIRW